MILVSWLVAISLASNPDPFERALETGATEPETPAETEKEPAVESVDDSVRRRQTETPIECRREDFASFDDFVACQEARLPPEPPRELQPEKVELPPPKLSPRLEALMDAEDFYWDLTVGTLVPGALLLVGGAITTGIGVLQVDEEQFTGGPMCTTGKRCGNTCIERADTCHVGSGEVLSKRGKILVGVGASAVLVGAVLTVVGGVGATRLAITRRKLHAALSFTGQSVVVAGRF